MSATSELLDQIAEMETRIEELQGERDALKAEAKTDKHTIDRLTDDHLALQHQMSRFEADRVAEAFHEHMRRTGRVPPECDLPWAAAPSLWRAELERVATEGGVLD